MIAVVRVHVLNATVADETPGATLMPFGVHDAIDVPLLLGSCEQLIQEMASHHGVVDLASLQAQPERTVVLDRLDLEEVGVHLAERSTPAGVADLERHVDEQPGVATLAGERTDLPLQGHEVEHCRRSVGQVVHMLQGTVQDGRQVVGPHANAQLLCQARIPRSLQEGARCLLDTDLHGLPELVVVQDGPQRFGVVVVEDEVPRPGLLDAARAVLQEVVTDEVNHGRALVYWRPVQRGQDDLANVLTADPDVQCHLDPAHVAGGPAIDHHLQEVRALALLDQGHDVFAEDHATDVRVVQVHHQEQSNVGDALVVLEGIGVLQQPRDPHRRGDGLVACVIDGVDGGAQQPDGELAVGKSLVQVFPKGPQSLVVTDMGEVHVTSSDSA